MAIRETIQAGRLCFTKLKSGSRGRQYDQKRRKKEKPTSEAVEKSNMRASMKNLTMILNHNYHDGDFHAVLTYSEIPDERDRIEKDFRNFTAKLNRRYKKYGCAVRWTRVFESQNTRPHFHVILNRIENIPQEEAEKIICDCWQHGHVILRRLYSDGDYRELAAYLIKETTKTFREPDAVMKKRFTHSKNVTYPEKIVEEVSNAMLLREPVAQKGYIIDEDSIYRGENPFTGMPYIEYVEKAIDPDPRRTTRRGKKMSGRETIFRIVGDTQLRFEFDAGC